MNQRVFLLGLGVLLVALAFLVTGRLLSDPVTNANRDRICAPPASTGSGYRWLTQCDSRFTHARRDCEIGQEPGGVTDSGLHAGSAVFAEHDANGLPAIYALSVGDETGVTLEGRCRHSGKAT